MRSTFSLLARPVLPYLLIILAIRSADPLSANDSPPRERPPNVVLILTDDQGYGDLGCHGNRELKTPALDALYRDSVRFTNFHVDPTCSPTRAALMTGRYSSRTGVWHTIRGRSLMRKDETTLPQLLAAAGYQTGIFGKWHLGDNYPLRAIDRGFRESLTLGGGGIGQTPDFWGNDYFDDTFLRNGTPEKQTGYCTDAFFRAAASFIEHNRERPFFAYIATNAPHSPYLVPDEAAKPYRDAGIPSPRAEFYGMIANIDENVGRLLRGLDEWKLRDDTIVVFMTDNGSAAGVDSAGGNNVGMRGMKGSEYDGGHRVPCFVRYPARYAGGRDVSRLTAHIDLLPTLLELCGISPPKTVALDGASLVPLLDSEPAEKDWPERTLFVHSQRVEHPEKWKQSAVMTERRRLINGRELYDIGIDPGQARDIAGREPDVVARLRSDYDSWWDSISTRFNEFVPIELGAEAAPRVTLTCHDWHSDQVPFDQALIKKDPEANGFWEVDFVRDGRYRVTLRARPEGLMHRLPEGTAKLQVGAIDQSSPVAAGIDHVAFEITHPAGPAKLQTWINSADGRSRGAFFVTIERISDGPLDRG